MDLYLPRPIAAEAFEVTSLAVLESRIESGYYLAPTVFELPKVLTRPRGHLRPDDMGTWEEVTLGNWVARHAPSVYRVFDDRPSFLAVYELFSIPADPPLPEGAEWCRSHMGTRRHVARYLTVDRRLTAPPGRSGRSLCGKGAEDDERGRYWASRRFNRTFTPTDQLPLCALCARAITPREIP